MNTRQALPAPPATASPLKITVDFITSAASAAGFPTDGLREVAMVGRSNVGKSSLINALLRQRVARTSAAPGQNTARECVSGATRIVGPFYLVDLPGYGYARGGREAAREFEELTQAYFRRDGAGSPCYWWTPGIRVSRAIGQRGGGCSASLM